VNDEDRSKTQLVRELTETRQRLAELEAAELEWGQRETQLNNSLEALQKNEQRMRHLIDALPVCISYVDRDLRYRLNNKRYEEWFGRQRSQITGRHIKEVLGDQAYAENEAFYQAVLGGETVTIERVTRTGDGKERHLVGTHIPDLNEQGKVQGFFALITDITDQVEAEQALQKREEQFRKIFDHSNDAIFLIDPVQDVILDANPKACHLLGYSRQELLSMGISAIHPREMPQLLTFAQSVMERGHGWTDELSCRTRKGQYLPAEMSASTVDIEGQSYMIALVRDTTRRKEAEQLVRREAARADALARAAARLNAHLTLEAVLDAVCEETSLALDVSAVMVMMFDETRNALYPATTRGLPPEYRDQYTPISRALYDKYAEAQGTLIVVPDVQTEAGLPNATLYAKHGIRTIVAHSLLREGQLVGTLNIYAVGQSRHFDDEELALLRGLANQASQAIENVRLRQQAQQAVVMAERHRLARELHDSVTQSLYSLTLLAEGWQRLARAGKLASIEDSLAELGEIAQQALKEMRLLVHELRPPDLERDGLLEALHQRLGAVEKRAGVEARLMADDVVELPSTAESELYRIAQEALNNALKHAGATSVVVRISTDSGRFELEVVDDGRGFDLETVAGQHGVGLVSMRERAEKLGGTLAVESHPGQGTKVKVSVEVPG
jgi:PAS domain S-box-containing protein